MSSNGVANDSFLDVKDMTGVTLKTDSGPISDKVKHQKDARGPT